MKEFETVALMIFYSGIAIIIYFLRPIILGPEISAFTISHEAGASLGFALMVLGIYLYVKGKKQK